jgi:hypothetical protein
LELGSNMRLGDRVTFNTKVNIDPLGSHCSLCGRKTTARFWFPVNWDDILTMPDAGTNVETDDHKGYYPVGSECAKSFDKGILIERH